MKSDIEVSVVIPAYNNEKTIDACLKSVLLQSVAPAEIIVVDDGSTDSTVQRAAAYAGVKVIQLECNVGVQAARNVGINAAPSDWIAFLDADDVWMLDNLLYKKDIFTILAKEKFITHVLL